MDSKGPGPRSPHSEGEFKDEFGLTAQHRLVCEEWLADPHRNKAKAYQSVYDPKGERTVRSVASAATRLFTREDVKGYLGMRMQQMANKYKLTQERIIEEWARLCFSDPRELFDEDGQLLLPQKWKDRASAAVASVKVSFGKDLKGNAEYTKEIRFWDKPKALSDAGRHLNMFQADAEANAPKVIVPQRLNAAQARAEQKRRELAKRRQS